MDIAQQIVPLIQESGRSWKFNWWSRVKEYHLEGNLLSASFDVIGGIICRPPMNFIFPEDELGSAD